MKRLRSFCGAIGLVAAMAGLATPAAAQTNDEIFPNLQWNFSTPGARANGMGKTFIGQADDASAAVTNPAGLMSLTRPQVYAEFKATRLRSARLSATDSLRTLQPTTTTTDINALSFASFSVPIKSKFAVAFSFHRFLDYEEQINLKERAIPGSPNTFLPVNASVDFAGMALGGSLAYMVTDSLRVGVTVARSQFDADTLSTRTEFAPSTIIFNQTSINDSQSSTSITLGGLYRVKGDKATVGFRYTKSPRFTTTENLQLNPSSTTNAPLTQATGFPKPVEINVPDHFGFGASFRPASKLLLAVDVVRTKYSSLSENTTIIFNTASVNSSEYETPDTTEVHVGAEYILGSIMGKPLFLRGGVFTNPSHLVSYTGTAGGNATALASETAKFNLLPRKDDTRGTAGAGVVLGSKTQVDLAYVFGREVVVSAAVRF